MPQHDPLPNLPDYDPEPADGVRVGESPVPGLTLKRILRGHEGPIHRIAWSPNGRFLASPSRDKTIRIWDWDLGNIKVVLTEHRRWVNVVGWSPNGILLATGSESGQIRLWNTSNWVHLGILEGHKGRIEDLAWSKDSALVASASGDGTVKIWSIADSKCIHTITEHQVWVNAVEWSPDGKFLATGAEDPTIKIWLHGNWKPVQESLHHRDWVTDIAWSPDGNSIASASGKNISIWDPISGDKKHTLEGHTDRAKAISFSADGRLLASKSEDFTVRIWRTDTWETIAIIQESAVVEVNPESTIAFHPLAPFLATLGQSDATIRIWQLDLDRLFHRPSPVDTINYTTAKIVLAGDTGVGKTGLGWRLAHGYFREQSSTHGQQFWVIDELGKTREDGAECETVLWDLAGQHVYRPIHSIFLDNVDASLVLFDPTNRQNPLRGVRFWLEQLKGKSKLPPCVLVGARSDRGASVLSQQELEQFCQRYGISGGYVSTSAKEGAGLEQLLTILKEQIPWDEMTTTVTTRTFKRIKEFVLSLKEASPLLQEGARGRGILVSPTELRQQLQATDETWQFSNAEMMTAVGHLETHGYVTILNSSSGNQFILLAPDLLVTLASSIVLLADKNPRELGAVNESQLLQGSYPFEELQGLEEAEQQILLDAAVLRFLEHNICFRERLDENVLLIFPGLIKQKRPLQDDIPSTDDISYIVRGRVENIYASLVVLLGYTPSFFRINQWQNQAQYETEAGTICGFRLIEDREGEIELILYYRDEMPGEERLEFQGLFERFLYQRDVQITPFPPVHCHKNHLQERAIVVKRQQSGKDFLFCDECGAKTALPDIAQAQTIGTSASPWLQHEEAIARLRSVYEAHLSRIKGYRRDWAAPRCYLSHHPDQEKWAAKLRHDLSDAGMYLIAEAAQVKRDDFVLILDTPAYQQAFKQRPQSLQDDVNLIQTRFADNKRNLIALVLSGSSTHPHDLNGCQPGKFCDETHYPVSLFDLVLNLYHIPLTSTGFAPLRQALHQQWEQTLMSDKSTFSSEIDLGKLRQLLNDRLNMDDVESICFNIVDFDNLPGNTKSNKIEAMISHFKNRLQLELLLEKIRQERPDIDLEDVYR